MARSGQGNRNLVCKFRLRTEIEERGGKKGVKKSKLASYSIEKRYLQA